MRDGGPTEAQIRQRAYEIYLKRGGQSGHETNDWLQAEYELTQLPIRKIAEMPASQHTTREGRKSALVHLVQAALILGAEALPHWKG